MERIESYQVPLRNLRAEPYKSIICYPRPSRGSVEARIKELRRLGVRHVEFSGRVRLGALHVLGKGTKGLVVRARADDNVVALKIRREDSTRRSSRDEARMLGLSNRIGVGPRLLGATRNFLMMELIEGPGIDEWVRALKGEGTADRLRAALKELLTQCLRLDLAMIDHGELSNLRKHVIIGKQVAIIDFESSSTKRRPANLTSATQYLFIGGPLSARIRKTLSIHQIERIIEALRQYKREVNETNFQLVLRNAKLMK